MKQLKLFLLAFLSLLGMNATHAETQSPYLYDFNTEINVSDHSFAPFGWGHIVDKYSTALGTTYVTYNYLPTGGVDNSGGLQIGNQTIDGNVLNDILVLPATTGDVSLYVKADAEGSYSTIKFYYVEEDNGVFTCDVNEDEIVMNPFTLSQTSFTKITLSELPAGTHIGIRGNFVTIDNISAESAEVVAYPKLAILSATSTMPTYVDTDANGNYTISYNVTVKNQGQRDLIANEEGFSLTLVNKNKNKSIVTVPITENIAMGESKTIAVSSTLAYSQYPDEATYAIRENINKSELEASVVKPYPHNPVVNLYQNGKVQGNEISLGTIQGSATITFTLTNDGASALTLTSVEMPEGFSTIVGAQTIEPHSSIDFPITFTATGSGIQTGTMVIKSNAADYTRTLKVMSVESTRFFANFEDNKIPAGMVAQEGWITSQFPKIAKMENNKYCAETDAQEPVMLATPLMEIVAGEPLYFEAGSFDTRAVLKVYCSTDRKNWTLLHTIDANGTDDNTTFSTEQLIDHSTANTSGAFRHYTVNNLPEGQYYIGFEGQYARLDNILSHTMVDVAHDITFVSSNIPVMGSVNHTNAVSATFRNNNSKTEAADQYQVNFYFKGTKVGSAESIDFTGGTSNEFTFNFTPHTAGTGSFYALFEVGGEVLASSDTINMIVNQETASSDVVVGVAKDLTHNSVPLHLYYMSSESETLYTAEQLGFQAGTKINKIVYKGWNESKDLSAAVKVFIANTNDAQCVEPYNKRDTTTMTKVFDGNYVFPKAGSKDNTVDMLVVRFNEPFEYTGGNLSIVVEHKSNSYANVRFESDNTITNQTIRRSNDSQAQLPTTAFAKDQLPVVTMSIEAEPKTISGTVTEKTTGNAIENAEVSLANGEVLYTGKTDAEGKYNINVYQSEKEYTMIVKATGYMPKKQQVSTFPANVDVQLSEAHGFFIEKENVVETGTVNYRYTATATAMNPMTTAFAEGSYTAKLYMGDEAVAEAKAVAIESGASADYKFTFVPRTAGTFQTRIEFVAGEDVTATEPVTVTISPESLGGTIQVLNNTQITNYSVPIRTYDKNSESQTIYTAEQLGIPAGAVIKSIRYRGYNETSASYNATLRVYIENTEDDYANGFVMRDSLEMTRIYNDSLVITKKGTKQEPVDYINIPIEKGFKYTGKNLRIAFHIEAKKYSKTYFVTDQNVHNTYRRSDDNLDKMIADPWVEDVSPVIWMDVEVGSKISGEIVDKHNQPISGATVSLTSGDVLYKAQTANDGKYEMTVAQIGLRYTATVAANGYKTNTHTISFENGDVVLNDTLRMPYYLRGNVKANTGNAIVVLDGATITVSRNDKSESGTSAADGTYEVVVGDDAQEQEYTVITSKNGYVSDTTTVTFTAESINYDVTLLKLNTISGAVYEEGTQTPITGVTVTITQDDKTYVTTTGENGNYSMGIPAGNGTYTITATMEGYNPGTGSVTLNGDDATASDIFMKPIADSINGITTEDGRSAGDVYTVNGQYVGRNIDMKSLPKGVYIINGKKVVIK